MPSVIGTVNASGQPVAGSHFTAKRAGTGEYAVQFAADVFSKPPIIVATPVTQENYTCAISTWDTDYAGFKAVVSNMSADFVDFGFSFIAQSPQGRRAMDRRDDRPRES